MVNVSQAFKNAVANNSPSDLRLEFRNEMDEVDMWFSGFEGDITTDGFEFNYTFNSSEDLTLGECCSNYMSGSVFNRDRTLKDFRWGKCEAYIGYGSAYESDEIEWIDYDTNVIASLGDEVFLEGRDDGLYRHTSYGIASDVETKLLSFPVYSIVNASDGTYILISDGVAYKYTVGGTATQYEMDKYLISKYMDNKIRATGSVYTYIASYSTVDVETSKIVTHRFEYCPMGTFYVDRPSKTLTPIVTINEAYDAMKKFDDDASKFLKEIDLGRPVTLAYIVNQLASKVLDVSTEYTFPHHEDRVELSSFGVGKTYRDILAYVAERAGCIAYIDRYEWLRLGWLRDTDTMIDAESIIMDGVDAMEYICTPPTKVVLKQNDGTYIERGAGSNEYQLLGNPLFTNISDDIYQTITTFPSYVPMTVDCILFDPSIEAGDMVTTYVGEDTILGEDETAYIPVMSERIVWNGFTSGSVTATGNIKRVVEDDDWEVYKIDTAAEGTEKVLVADSPATDIIVSNNTWTQVASLTLSPGSWVLFAHGAFASNATGQRYLSLSSTSTNYYCDSAAPVSGARTTLEYSRPVQISEETTFVMKMRQSSGGDLATVGAGNSFILGLEALKVGA